MPKTASDSSLQVVIASRDADPASARWAREAGLTATVVQGSDPAAQRNAGAAGARAEVLWFVDDDTEFDLATARRGLAWFEDPGVVGVGGPCPPHPGRPLTPEQATAYGAMASRLGFGPSRARYTPVGVARVADESVLIGSNLMVRSSAFREAGGFPEGLFPNEENLLMDRLRRLGSLIYDPSLLGYREPPRTLAQYYAKVRKYGGGRWRQYQRDRTWRNAMKVLVGLGSAGSWVAFPLTALVLGPRLAAAVHGTHGAYAAGIFHGMRGVMCQDDGSRRRVR